MGKKLLPKKKLGNKREPVELRASVACFEREKD
jgi:hypothetical protein